MFKNTQEEIEKYKAEAKNADETIDETISDGVEDVAETIDEEVVEPFVEEVVEPFVDAMEQNDIYNDAKQWLENSMNSARELLGDYDPIKFLQDIFKRSDFELWNDIVEGVTTALKDQTLNALTPSALKGMIPITVTDDRYIGLEFSFSWPEEELSGKKSYFPTIKVSVSSLQQQGMQATVGDLQLAATLGL